MASNGRQPLTPNPPGPFAGSLSRDVAGPGSGPPPGDGVGPRIEVVTGHEPRPGSGVPPRRPVSFLLWFLAAFALVLLPATAWNFSREPVYRATATVLTTVPASRSGAGSNEADLQHVAIQRQILLGRELLADLLERVDDDAPARPPTPDDLRPMLRVDAVPGTNLVELSAEGGQPLLLADLVNAWLDAYEGLRQTEIEARVGTQLAKLGDEADALELKIADKRAALKLFRERHDIVTLERDSNRALKRLNTLQASLADAEDAQIKARARVAAVEAASRSDQPVIAEEQAQALATLQQRESELGVRVAQLRKRYTEMFIENDPDKRALPEELARVRARIDTLRRQGVQAALTHTRREANTATDRLLRLQREFSEQKRRAALFSASFEQYQTLQKDLSALEEMQRETETERVSVEARAIDDYPQIEVIEPAYPPRDPVRPLYLRDLGYSILAAGAAGLLAMLGLLLFDNARRPRSAGPMTGVRIYDDGARRPATGGLPGGGAPSERLGHGDGLLAGVGASPRPSPALPDAFAGTLPSASPRQLMAGEVEALWEIADDAERQLMGLLLCGLDEPEIAALTDADFDLDLNQVRAPNDGRTLCLPPALMAALLAERQRRGSVPAWRDAAEAKELGHRIELLALDAGIAHADEVTPALLRHTYLAYLVRQGVRLTELHRIAGGMDAATIRRYAPLSPTGASRPLEQLRLTYPLLTE